MAHSLLLGVTGLAVSLFVGASPIAAEKADIVRTGAFDIGSGSFKMKVADVNVDTQRVVGLVEVGEEFQQVKVSAAEDLAHASDGRLSAKLQKTAVTVFKSMVKEAERLGATRFVAGATGAFRDAANGLDVLGAMEQETHVPVALLDKRRESLLGYYAAYAASEVAKMDLVVWDVGGSSQQLAFMGENNRLEFYSDAFASVRFKNTVIGEVQKMRLGDGSSPNPMTVKEARDALALASTKAKSVPETIKDKISDKNAVVVGIGGVHVFSVAGQLNKAPAYDKDDVVELLNKRIKLQQTDDDLKKETGTKYPETDVTNLILISAYMDTLGISHVKVVDANMADGLLVAPALDQL